MKQFKKIAVLGGTGKAGRFVIKQLLEKGYEVKALTRNPAKLTQSSRSLEIIQGDARDAETIHLLLKGCDAVISTIGPAIKTPDTCSIATGHVIDAAKRNKIKRYIELAGLAIDTPSDKKGFKTKLVVSIMKLFVPKIITDRQKAYGLLSGSDLDWTLVRSSMIELTDTRRVIKTSLYDSPGRKISATDLANFLVDELTNEKYIRKAPFISS
ncbi:MAG: NAD(P)H-binding protein [Bacteroidales bacterium]|nr:NAD(P)H-binding protein [Bacteroidales bacterium]